MSHVVITGAGVGNTANRLEIHDFVKDEKFFSLYIQALRKSTTNCHRYLLIRFLFPERISSDFDQDNVESFFSVGGIHGLPNIPWDGAVGDTPFVPNSRQWGGYCTHGSVLFPTWHRPYVALFEVCRTSFFLPVLVIDEKIILLANFGSPGLGNRF